MDMKKHLRTVLVLSAALGISTTMPASVVMASTNSTTASVSASSTTNNSQFTKDQIAGLNHLNAIRKHMGLNPVQLSPILCKSAENHVNYLGLNGNSVNETNIHDETQGNPGFTGGGPTSRVKSLGGSFYMVGEAIGNSDNAPDMVDRFFSGVYHRDILLDPRATYIGIASSGSQYVIDVGYSSTSTNSGVFPYSGQKSVQLRAGDEYPNPLAQFGNIGEAGYPISIYLPSNEMSANGKWSYSLTDSKGNNIPIYSEIGQFFPKNPLRHDETYTATAKFTATDGTVLFNKTWSFTTKLSQAQKFQAKFGKSQNGQPIGKIVINQDIGYIDASGNMGIKWHKGAVYNVYGVSIPYTGTDLYNLGKYGSINSDAGVTFFLGIVYSPSKPLTVYNSDGSVYKTFKPNQKFRVTSEKGNKLYVAKDKYVLKSSSIVFQK